MVKKLTIITLIIFINISNVRANCEAGGYFIHTKATYHLDKNILFLKGGTNPERMNVDVETQDTSLPAGKYKISNSIHKCESITIKVEKNNNEMIPEKYTLDGCSDINANSNYLYQVDVAKKIIAIGNVLPVNETANLNASAIEKNISSFLDKTTIIAQTMEDTSFNENIKRIDRSDILNSSRYRYIHTQVGKNFSMSIALLDIKNLPKYFSLYDIPLSEQKRVETAFSSMTASFPVIYFTKNGKTEFVGDGAWCSDKAVKDLMYNLFISDKSAQPKSNLGDIYKYKITNAYDLNDDGEPDIITINDVVSYWLKDINSLLVIETQHGC